MGPAPFGPMGKARIHLKMPALREVKAHRRAILILVLLSAAIFANTFRNEFVLDDNLLIVEDQSIRDPLTCLRNLEYLRCVNTITFMIDYSIWGLNPFGFHLTNLILHVLCVIGLYALVIMVFGNRRIALLTALRSFSWPCSPRNPQSYHCR
jgi:hypothetical protein